MSAECVKVFNNEGKFLYDIGTEGPDKLHCPVGLAVDKFNNLIVCDKTIVHVFTLEGKFLNSIKGRSTDLHHFFAVAVSSTGELFITDIERHSVDVFE